MHPNYQIDSVITCRVCFKKIKKFKKPNNWICLYNKITYKYILGSQSEHISKNSLRGGKAKIWKPDL